MSILLSSCSFFQRDISPSSGTIEFSTPEQLPSEVSAWVDGLRDAQNEDWMRYNDHIFVAVARGEMPNAGYSVVIEDISYYSAEKTRVEVSARYVQPEPDKDYAQVVTYPVAVAAFSIDDLPDTDMGSLEVTFQISEDENTTITTPTKTITLFFGSQDGFMVRAYRSLQTDILTPEMVTSEIVLGPKEPGLVPILPEGTKLMVTRDDENAQLAIVDYSEEIYGVQGSLGELLAVYGVVNALVENDLDIESVKVTIAGQAVDSLGHIDLTKPLTFDDALLKEEK